jgi:hypothetical protein
VVRPIRSRLSFALLLGLLLTAFAPAEAQMRGLGRKGMYKGTYVQGDVGAETTCEMSGTRRAGQLPGDPASEATCEMRAAGQLGACSEHESTPGGLSVDRRVEPSLTTISEAGESALEPEPSIPHDILCS